MSNKYLISTYFHQSRLMDDTKAMPMIAHSQGVHIVLDKSFLPGDSAIMVPHTDDGRVLFAIPWHEKILIGTTDTPMKSCPLEPEPLLEEIHFLLKHAARYLSKDPTPEDVLSMFAGIRPLVTPPEAKNTAAISREHIVCISPSGLVTIAGGKWTTYRKMAEDTLDQAILVGGLEFSPCLTADIQIHGFHKHAHSFQDLAVYGSDALGIQTLAKKEKGMNKPIHPAFKHIKAEVIWAVREEMAMTISDFLSRRSRALLLDAKASVEMAPEVARLMMTELNKNEHWMKTQIESYQKFSAQYILGL